LVILFLDYSNRFKYRFNRYSFLFLKALGMIMLLAIINILLSSVSLIAPLRYILLIIGFYIIFFLPLFLYEYVEENFLLSKYYVKFKKYFKMAYLFFIPVLIFLTFVNGNSILETPFNISEYSHYPFLLLMSLIPGLLMLIEYGYYVIFKKENKDVSIFMISLFSLISIIVSLFIKDIYLLTPLYTVIVLQLYEHKNNLLNTRDVLTGLYNREVLKKIESNRRISSKKTVIYMIDVNKFKQINDTYGHDKGDKVLKDVAKLLLDTVRKTDYVVRFGGDEFIIIADFDDPANAPVIINKIENNLKNYNRLKKLKVSLSIGYEVLKPNSNGEYDIYKQLKKADQKMYKEKRKES
jgi:diguanylate cyclase (GGDEF)-like protein